MCRIESIGSLETQGKFGSIQRKQITLVDNDGVKLKFLLWGEQVLLANLLRWTLVLSSFFNTVFSPFVSIMQFLSSVGSMLALDRPFIASSVDSVIEACGELCLEYGSATQIYLVPFIQQEEQVSHFYDGKLCNLVYGVDSVATQVSISLTPNRYQGSRLPSTFDPSQGPKVSQVILPCDSQGSIDFSNYPFQVSFPSLNTYYSFRSHLDLLLL